MKTFMYNVWHRAWHIASAKFNETNEGSHSQAAHLTEKVALSSKEYF